MSKLSQSSFIVKSDRSEDDLRYDSTNKFSHYDEDYSDDEGIDISSSFGNIFSSVEDAVRDIAQGKIVIVMDDESRENEGDLIMAAEFVTTEDAAFFRKYTTGILCTPLTPERAAKLKLPRMVNRGTDPNGTAFTVTTDADGTGTGVSGLNRSLTVNRLADPNFDAQDFNRPGHIFPLVARPGGVLERRGHTEASVDLCRLAGVQPVGFIGELVRNNKDGDMMRLSHCVRFAKRYGLKIITVDAMVEYIKKNPLPLLASPPSVELEAECEIPIKFGSLDLGQWTMKTFYSNLDSETHVVLVKGDVYREHYDPVLTRVHSECFTGDVLGSQRCDCGEQKIRSLHAIHERGRGVFIYVLGHEGRGIGLSNKIQAYKLQHTKGLNTYEANEALGFDHDLRSYETPNAILRFLGIKKISLLSNNMDKIGAFGDLVHSVVPIDGTPNAHNAAYLEAKRVKRPGNAENPSRVKSIPACSHYETVKTFAAAETVVNGHTDTLSNIAFDRLSNELHERNHEHLKVGIVYTQWNGALIKPFAQAIQKEFENAGVVEKNLSVEEVPGSWETMWDAQRLAKKCDVVLILGLLIKGETLHFEMISNQVASGLKDIMLSTGVPIINGVMNCLTEGQAEARCDVKSSELIKSLTGTALVMAHKNRDSRQAQ